MSLARIAPVLALAAALALPTAAAAAPAGHGLTLADMDTTVAPCQDFYRYADGGWIARTPIPPAYSRYGGFEELQDRNLEHVHQLLEDAVRQLRTTKDANLARLGAFYGSCMDSGHAELEGDRPIQPALARIAALKSASELGVEVARLQAEGVRVPFFFTGMADPGNSAMVIATAGQGGLGLPERDYYFKSDSASQHVRAEYVEHVSRSLQLVGVTPVEADKQARSVMALETGMAGVSMSPVQQRDPRATYHKMAYADFRKLCPGFDWLGFLGESRVTGVTEVNVRQPAFFAGLDSLLRAAPLDDWKAYLRWHLVRSAAPALSSPFVQEDFRFAQVLSGAKEIQPRWRRCIEMTDRSLGEPLGQVYVKTYFTPAAKARALTMVQNLKAALRDRIQQLDWMGEATKAQALKKLDAMGIKIGYPDKWRDFSGLRLGGASFYDDLAAASRFERAYRLGRIDKPVDKGEFSMTPPTVNARYSPSLNDILFPAGILQPPFFDPEADDAVNYGGIGTVIGHEMTHGFDDSGRKFDEAGNLRDWWTADDARNYQGRVDRIIAQYDGYTVVDTVHVNGRLTTGENIADVGGVTVAFAALQKALAGKPRPLLDGFTPEQRFFLAYARIWRQVIRPAEAVRRINIDPHSPGEWRVRGPLSDIPAFYEAFGCRSGDPMERADDLRVVIW